MAYTLDIDDKYIIKYLKKIPYNMNHVHYGEAGIGISKSFTILDHLPKLVKETERSYKHYIEEILRLNTKFRLANSWATKAIPNAETVFHFHKNTWLSAVYYPQSDPAFIVQFSTPTAPDGFWAMGVPRDYNIHNSLVWNITPEKNTLLVFNSMLARRIAQNTSKNTRYSIASNMMPKGVIGFHDTKVVL